MAVRFETMSIARTQMTRWRHRRQMIKIARLVHHAISSAGAPAGQPSVRINTVVGGVRNVDSQASI